MSSLQVGDTRTITVPGHIRKTIGSVTKYLPGETYKVLQTYQEKGRLNFGNGRELVSNGWVDTAFVE